ncbi:MAG: hypothetical protein NTZ80_00445 [Patescibacteria group bacterium]|nr:hypothetical protein [Patescibacteria group bacterium]
MESTKELPEPLPKSNFSLEEWFATKIECFEKENFSKLIDGMPVKRGYYSCTGDGPYSNVNYFLVEKDGKIYEFSTNVSEGQMMLASFKFLQ